MTLDITASDFFCGAGGSSTGMVAAGVRVQHAANHWQLAIETHNTNHPETDHDCADLRGVHPSNYPSTTIAWFSPECTNHSLAKGRKRKNIHQLDLWGNNEVDPAEERSRATMREVVEFSEYHRYEVVIVENVVDIRHWAYYDDWLTSMHNLGYLHKALYLNSQFFGVPQSRDRVYVVFWKRGNRAPDLDFRPAAVCEKHGQINAVQAWKKPGFPWGRYGDRRQYIYRCPHCYAQVEPATVPAASVIDWSIPAPLIGERDKPLKPKTIERIKAGLRKFALQSITVPATEDRYAGVDPAFMTPAREARRYTVSLPFITMLQNNAQARGADHPLATILTSGAHHALTLPPYILHLKGSWASTGLDEPLSTIIASASQQWLTLPPMLLSYMNNATDPKPVTDPMMTVAGGFTPPLVIPPFITTLRQSVQHRGLDESLSTISAGGNNHALITPFLMQYYGTGGESSVEEPMPVITTVDRHALVEPDADEIVEACGFRMLQPHELKLGMSFPDSYIILGNKRDQVRQIGNAVCCEIARLIVERCVESLAS